MLKQFLMKQAMKSQLKGVPEAQKQMIMDMVEKHPDFFEKIAVEIQNETKNGKDQQTAAMEVMMKYKAEFQRLMSQGQ